jgi:hypothetical protein
LEIEAAYFVAMHKWERVVTALFMVIKAENIVVPMGGSGAGEIPVRWESVHASAKLLPGIMTI